VIDLGCGFGLDSIIASKKVGLNGKVYSVDISKEEIRLA
jgi:ubiquinone/menaquinone biosynthesis C-methylase UbiE